MTEKQKQILRNTASLKNTLLLAIPLLIMLFYILPEAKKQIIEYAPEAKIIDAMMYYSPDQLWQMIETYGDKGRALYIVLEWSADFISSIVIAAFICSFLIFTQKKLAVHFIKFEFLIWLPASSVLINCLENIGIIWMLSNYPSKYFYIAIATSISTLLKWILIFACLGLCLINTIFLIRTKFNLFQKEQVQKSTSSNC